MSMLNVAGLQLKYLTAYNEYIADIIIATIVYLSAFAMFFKLLIKGKQKNESGNVNAETEVKPVADANTEGGEA